MRCPPAVLSRRGRLSRTQPLGALLIPLQQRQEHADRRSRLRPAGAGRDLLIGRGGHNRLVGGGGVDRLIGNPRLNSMHQ